ncbi:hypothetical protein EXN66_Car018854 [Channa argus]|uniref:Ig-like domain-containing protein n=1 Tax=Channa argus TaxID=215402 RepID=A0A6G1QM49_CHAAH|nr:hypothetical protein EXN66_Car018854 [Channa argus]
MVEHRWIQTLFLLILEFQFTGASYFIRGGGEITLTCKDVINDQNNCEKTTWLFSGSGNTAAVELVNLGKIKTESKSKSHRLSVTENCSLVIKKVTDEDVGHYTCRQFEPGQKEHLSESVVYVSVVTMTQHKDTDKVTFNCSVWTHGLCSYTVKWLYDGKDVKINAQGVKISQSSCTNTVHFLTPLYKYQSNSFTCEVTDGNNKHQFPFSLQPPGDNTITTTPKSELSATTASTNTGTKPADLWWLYVIAALVLLTLIVVVILWKRSKGNRTQLNDKAKLNSLPLSQSAAETSPDMTDPEDGVSYASISYTKKTKTKAQAQSRNDDDAGDAVTYTTLKVSSADPNIIYASIN